MVRGMDTDAKRYYINLSSDKDNCRAELRDLWVDEGHMSQGQKTVDFIQAVQRTATGLIVNTDFGHYEFTEHATDGIRWVNMNNTYRGDIMLELVLKLYTTAMMGDVRSPLPHLVGPPGCGKSTVVEQAAELIGVNLHIINVARISPLDLEGVQMPVGKGDDMLLRLLHATQWTSLQEGDIVLLDEFLRGFPEVYNGLLDILTSRQVGGLKLPKVFIIGASNSTIAYDKALEDRLLHLPVPDPRNKKAVRKEIAQRIVDTLGLLPQMGSSMEMQRVLDDEIAPMYEILDQFKQGRSTGAVVTLKGRSIRNLIGQVQMREIQSEAMMELITMNNTFCVQQSKHQFMVLPNGRCDPKVAKALADIKDNPKLSPVQQLNIRINLQLVEMEAARKEGIQVESDDVFFDELD